MRGLRGICELLSDMRLELLSQLHKLFKLFLKLLLLLHLAPLHPAFYVHLYLCCRSSTVAMETSTKKLLLLLFFYSIQFSRGPLKNVAIPHNRCSPTDPPPPHLTTHPLSRNPFLDFPHAFCALQSTAPITAAHRGSISVQLLNSFMTNSLTR